MQTSVSTMFSHISTNSKRWLSMSIHSKDSSRFLVINTTTPKIKQRLKLSKSSRKRRRERSRSQRPLKRRKKRKKTMKNQ